jgi:hypothetical protein
MEDEMKTYQLKEPTVQAAVITGVSYTLDDGSTQADTTDVTAVGSYYVVQTGSPDTIVSSADFTAKYVPLA